eukprot:Gb_39069 [translate_table: standard]
MEATDDIAEEISFQALSLLGSLLNDILQRDVGQQFTEKVERELIIAQQAVGTCLRYICSHNRMWGLASPVSTDYKNFAHNSTPSPMPWGCVEPRNAVCNQILVYNLGGGNCFDCTSYPNKQTNIAIQARANCNYHGLALPTQLPAGVDMLQAQLKQLHVSDFFLEQ